MKFKEFQFLVKTDLYRYGGKVNTRAFLKNMMRTPGFKYTFYLRLCKYLKAKPITRYSLFVPARLILEHYSYKFGMDISHRTKIGTGFYIGHFGGIVVNPHAVIGDNCNISQGVTLGQANRGKNKGYPVLGNNVYIGPGAKIIGNIRVGNNVAIGANAVCTKDIPDNAVVAGIPAEIVSYNGSYGYVNLTGYASSL